MFLLSAVGWRADELAGRIRSICGAGLFRLTARALLLLAFQGRLCRFFVCQSIA